MTTDKKALWKNPGEVIGNVLQNAGLQEAYRRNSTLLYWNDVVGAKIAEKAQPREIDGKTLYVDVVSSAWLQELTFMKVDILRELNERVGGNAIDQIIFFATGSEGRE